MFLALAVVTGLAIQLVIGYVFSLGSSYWVSSSASLAMFLALAVVTGLTLQLVLGYVFSLGSSYWVSSSACPWLCF